MGSNSTRSVSYHHFGWAFPGSAKSRVDEGRSIALKSRFFDFPNWGETKKHNWDRIPRGRFHTTILGRLFQAPQKAGGTKVVQLRWKLVFSTVPIGEKRKNTLGIEIHEVGILPAFWVCFSTQGKKPGWRRSSNCVKNSFFRLSQLGRKEKTPLGSNSTKSVSYQHFGWAFPRRAKSRVDEGRPIALKTRFFDFPNWGETKKHPWDQIPRGRFHTTILAGLFQAAQKAELTNIFKLSSKRFFDFPNRPDTKKHPWDRIPRGRFHTTILGGLFLAAQRAGLTKVVQLRWKLVFPTFPIGAKRKNTLGIEFHEVGFIPPFWVGFSWQRKEPGWRRSFNCVEKSFFRLSQLGRNEKTPLRSNSTRSVSYHHLGRLFQEPQKAGGTKVVQLRWKLVFSTVPIGEKRKNTLGIEFHEVGILPAFWLCFSTQGKKPGWRRSSNCVKNSFFRLSQLGRNKKTPLGSNSTRSVSYHHFGWAFPGSAKSRVDEGRPIALKTRFFDFPNWGKTKKHPWDRIPRGRFLTSILGGLFHAGQKAGLTKVVQLRWKLVFSTFPTGAKRKKTLGIEFHVVGFIPPFWVGFSRQRKEPGWRRSSSCVGNSFFRLSQLGRNKKNTLGIKFHEVGFIPSFWVGFSRQRKEPGWRRSSNCAVNSFFPLSQLGRNEKKPLGSNSTRSVSYHHFGWAFPGSAKSRVDEYCQIALKTSFLTFAIREKRKNTLGIEFNEVGFTPPFWVGFPRRAKSRIDEYR